MLNRRLLRSKVVQALYAIIIAEESNRQLAYDEIAEAYKPDLNSMEPQNLPQLERYRQLATKLFDELVEKGEFTLTDEIPHSVEITAKKAFAAYRNANKRDRQNSVKRVLAETENIYTNVIYSLRFLTDLAHSARLERNRTHHNVDDPIPLRSGLDSNIIIKALENDKKLADEAVRRAVSWADDIDIVQRTYREVLRKDSAYRAYCEKVEHTLEEDQELIQNIVKHASATYAVVQLMVHEGKLNLTVEDNGKGFDTNEQKGGFGLQNLRYRIDALQGRLSIMSAKGRSTTIHIELELEKLKLANG